MRRKMGLLRADNYLSLVDSGWERKRERPRSERSSQELLAWRSKIRRRETDSESVSVSVSASDTAEAAVVDVSCMTMLGCKDLVRRRRQLDLIEEMGDGGGGGGVGEGQGQGQGQNFIVNSNGFFMLVVMLVRVSVVFAFIPLSFTSIQFTCSSTFR